MLGLRSRNPNKGSLGFAQAQNRQELIAQAQSIISFFSFWCEILGAKEF
nr:MAG TPA: Protein of unknown function (DUF3935) [Caudoviricetes sp.]